MNQRFCSIPLGFKNGKYDRCEELAIYKVKDSDWYICENHAIYANKQRWELEKLKKI
jgi:hypothetical protein